MSEVNTDKIPQDLVSSGYLQEANRQFFHLLGLALGVVEEDDGSISKLFILDYRDDPEGMAFDDAFISSDDAKKNAGHIKFELARKSVVRLKNLGYVVQPV